MREDGLDRELTTGGLVAAEAICLWLATIYADHPDYRQEWRPDASFYY